MSQALLIGAVAFGAIGQISQGIAASDEAKTAARMAEYNASVADQNAKREIEAAKLEEAQQRDRLARTLGSAGVARAKSGIRATGSSIFVQDDSIIQGELDALLIRNKGELASNAQKVQAQALRMQASQYKAQAKNAKIAGYMGAATTILGGAYSSKAFSGGANVGAATGGRSIPIDFSTSKIPSVYR